MAGVAHQLRLGLVALVAFLAVDAEFDRAEEEGYDGFIRADSIEELAEKLGIDADKLEETLDDYNDMSLNTLDSKANKESAEK